MKKSTLWHRITLAACTLAWLVVLACTHRSESEVATEALEQAVLQMLNLPTSPFTYAGQSLPAHLANDPAATSNASPTNPTTNWGATLGRVLFYDKNLSRNRAVSCASCHRQANGFSDPNQFSTGLNGGLTGRNSMGLASVGFHFRAPGPGPLPSTMGFFWDTRAQTLEQQALRPIQDTVEMNLTLPELEARLQALAYYPQLFRLAFGDATINSDRIARALAQFMRSMVSYQSKYDIGVPMGFANYTAQENQGRQLFFDNARTACAVCHTGQHFLPNAVQNNGLDLATTDRGLGGVSSNTADDGKMRAPSLRNIELTAPYMHDGRFATLEQVVEHYNSGVQLHPNLAGPLRQPGNNNQVRVLNLTAAEKQALVAFLKTLTDNNFTTDIKFTNPFRTP